MIRLFTAIEVPPDIADDLEPRLQGLPGARWRPDGSLHVTLRFHGEMQETVAADLDTELSRVAGKPFDLELKGVDTRGEGHQLHAVWAKVVDSEPLTVLAGRCESAAKRAGLAVERRAYRPHVTLAYLDARADPHKVAEWVRENSLLSVPPWRVTWFGLYSSWRSAEGSRYELEREYALI